MIAQNGSLTSDVWAPITLALASSRAVLQLSLPNPTTNIAIARSAVWAGYSALPMALDFCEGTIAQGTGQGHA